MREVQVVAWCDLCAAEGAGQREPATSHVVTLDGAKPLEIDLCTQHEQSSGLDGLGALLTAFGRAPGKTTAGRNRGGRRASQSPSSQPSTPGGRFGRQPVGGRPYVCPWCPLDYAGSSALMVHVGKVHGLPELRGANAVGRLLGGHCPLCGADALAIDHHTRSEHGATWGLALRQAREAGDSHGVVAALDRQATDVQAVA